MYPQSKQGQVTRTAGLAGGVASCLALASCAALHPLPRPELLSRNPPDAAEVTRSLESDDADLRCLAVEACTRSPEPTCRSKVTTLAQSDPDPQVRSCALASAATPCTPASRQLLADLLTTAVGPTEQALVWTKRHGERHLSVERALGPLAERPVTQAVVACPSADALLVLVQNPTEAGFSPPGCGRRQRLGYWGSTPWTMPDSRNASGPSAMPSAQRAPRHPQTSRHRGSRRPEALYPTPCHFAVLLDMGAHMKTTIDIADSLPVSHRAPREQSGTLDACSAAGRSPPSQRCSRSPRCFH